MEVKITEIRIDKIPQDFEEFIKAAVDIMIDPINAAALFIFALNIYSKDKDKGYPLVNFMLADNISPLVFSNIEKKPHIARSYLKGSTPENNYSPTSPYTVIIRSDKEKGIRRNLKTVYIGCGGTESYRPLTLIKVKRKKHKTQSKFNLWFVKEYPSIILDVKEITK